MALARSVALHHFQYEVDCWSAKLINAALVFPAQIDNSLQ